MLLSFIVPLRDGAAQQGTGRIAGRVVSAQSGQPVAAAQVLVQGTALRGTTDVGGRYSISGVPAGARALSVSASGFAGKTVTGINVQAGQTAETHVSLATSITSGVLALEGLTVTAEAERGSTSALLSERRNAATVVDAIGADQISRTPDGDAASALRRVPGISVVEGKYVYVRGLGERYGNTTLNGATLPSPIPDKKAVPLDIIPSSLLESVVTAKTYSPEQPGDYAGGLVQIETRTAPTSRTLRLSAGSGFTTGTTGQAGLGNPGLNFLGFGGGEYGLPAGLPRNGPARLPSEGAERDAFVRGLTSPNWGPTNRDVPLNQSYGLAFGDEVNVFGRALGVIGTVTYSSSTSQPEDRAERFFGVQDGAPARQTDYEGTVTASDVTVGALANASLRINDTDRVTLTGIYNRLAENQARILSGFYASQGPFLRQTRVQYVANTLANAQLRGEHLLEGLGNLGVRWRLAYSRAGRDEPGTRSVIYRATDEQQPFTFFSTTESGLTLHQELTDDALNPGADLKLPFTFRGEAASFSFGGSADVRDRSVYTRRLRLVPDGALSDAVAVLDPNQLFTAERIGSGTNMFRLDEATFAGDNYDAEQKVYAGYAMLEAEVLPRLRLSGGARVEQARIDLSARNQLGTDAAGLPDAELDNLDVLPALNLTYAATDEMNVRLGVSRTVARPQFRELAPYLYTDYFGGFTVIGNPRLERTSILNADLRWEWFLGTGSVVSVGAFGKSFDKPIEPLGTVLGANQALSYFNSDDARVYGAEVELRTNLGRLAPALQDFSLNANLTLVHSEVNADQALIYDVANPATPLVVPVTSRSRPLFGQSPYVVNAGLTYARQASGTTATLLFNRFGRRIDALGGQELPDIYEEGRTQVDLTLEQDLFRGLALKFSAGRLLGDRVEYTQTFPNGETVNTREYRLGRSFSLGVSWEPGND